MVMFVLFGCNNEQEAVEKQWEQWATNFVGNSSFDFLGHRASRLEREQMVLRFL